MWIPPPESCQSRTTLEGLGVYGVGGDGEVPRVGGSEGVEHGGVSGISRPPAAKQKQSEVPGNLSLAEASVFKLKSGQKLFKRSDVEMFGAPVKSCISKSSSCVSGATTSCSLSSHNLNVEYLQMSPCAQCLGVLCSE